MFIAYLFRVFKKWVIAASISWGFSMKFPYKWCLFWKPKIWYINLIYCTITIRYSNKQTCKTIHIFFFKNRENFHQFYSLLLNMVFICHWKVTIWNIHEWIFIHEKFYNNMQPHKQICTITPIATSQGFLAELGNGCHCNHTILWLGSRSFSELELVKRKTHTRFSFSENCIQYLNKKSAPYIDILCQHATCLLV